MEQAFTGEVIEWRGPAPYLFVAMTPEGRRTQSTEIANVAQR